MVETNFIEDVIDQAVQTSIEATPRMIAVIFFILFSALVYRTISESIRSAVSKVSESKRDKQIIQLFIKSVVSLIFVTICLFILGFDQLARILGTLSGVIILTTSYAMKEAIKEVVSGLYLIHDEKFVVGNKVTADGTTGVIVEIGIRRTEIESDEDDEVTIISNSKIEPKWTYHKESN